MKPLKVIMSAFGSYAGVETVDFERLDHGIFLITGDTGAGKTTIFDAVAFALFGETSGQKRDGSMMRSHYAADETETSVRLLFEEKGGIYEITRSPAYSRVSKRKNKDGQYGVIQAPPRAELKLADGQEFQGSIREINQKIQEILGVDYGQFSQICMIAQGDYVKLLHASSKERKDIFARIFNTGIYGRIQLKLKERNHKLYGRLEDNRKLCAHELANVTPPEEETLARRWQELLNYQETGRQKLAETLEAILESDRKKEQAVREERIERQGRLTETEGKIRQAASVNELLDRLAEAEERKARLENETGIWKERKERLAAAKKAAAVENTERQLREKQKEQAACGLRIERLEKEAGTLAIQREAAQAALEKCRIETESALPELTAGITRLKDVMPLYDRLMSLRDECGKSVKLEEEAGKECGRLAKERGLLAEAAGQIEERLPRLEKEADRLPELMAGNAGLKDRHESLRRLEQSALKLEEYTGQKRKMQAAMQEAQRDYEAAEQEYNGLYREFLAAQAGLMARELAEGSPCPVCGATNHPRKAKLSGDGISQAKVEESKGRRDRAEAKRARITQEGIQAVERCRHQETGVREEWQLLMGGTFAWENAMEKIKLAAAECGRALDASSWEEKKAREALENYRDSQKQLAENEKKQKDIKAKEEISKDTRVGFQLKLAGLKAELDQIGRKLPGQDRNEAEAKLARLEGCRKQLEQRQNMARDLAAGKAGEEKEKKGRLASERENSRNLMLAAEGLRKTYAAALQDAGFDREEEYRSALMPPGLMQEWEQGEREFDQELLKTRTIYEQLKIQTDGKTRTDIGGWREQAALLTEELGRLHEEESRLAGIRSRNGQAGRNLGKLWKDSEKLEEEYRVIHSLYQTANGKLSGMAGLDFQTYVQRQYFKQMIQAANRRLAMMTGGQFVLMCRELDTLGKQGEVGLDLDVYSMVTDKIRDVKTLSGGESFMAALAMALGMADVIQNTAGNIRMEAMFIDEGFGSLDEETRMRAIRVLQELAGGKRLVGIISHVQELKEQIDRKLIVQKSEKGSRIVCAVDEM